MIHTPSSTHAAQDGLAELLFEPRDGRTRLISLRTRSPLAVQRALYTDEGRPDLAEVIVANPTAGLLAGDRHQIRVRVAPGARARVTTQAATKVLSMPSGQAEQWIAVHVKSGGLLELFPRAVIPFRCSSLAQRVEIEVEQGGTGVYGEVLGLGRVESGERLAFRCISMDLSVSRPGGECLYLESYRLAPAEGLIGGPGVFGPEIGAVGTLIVVSENRTPDEQLERVLDLPGRNAAGVGGASLPGGGGIVVKVLARSVAEAEETVLAAMSALPSDRILKASRATPPGVDIAGVDDPARCWHVADCY